MQRSSSEGSLNCGESFKGSAMMRMSASSLALAKELNSQKRFLSN